jgi:hypothetical protein
VRFYPQTFSQRLFYYLSKRLATREPDARTHFQNPVSQQEKWFGNKKGKKGKKGKKRPSFAFFALFAFFVSSSHSSEKG